MAISPRFERARAPATILQSSPGMTGTTPSAPLAVRKVILIGSGPAGHTAAIYSSRASLAPLMFEGRVKGGIPGGQLMITNDVENYPGFPEKIAGPELMSAFRAQAVRQGAEIRTEDVNRVDLSVHPFRVWAGDDDEEHAADALIIATGAQAKWLGIPSEDALKGRGVSACAVCDGAFFRNQDVMVVGGGDTAMEEAMYLSGICKTVTLIHRREAFRASKTMQERVLGNAKVRVIYNAAVEEILGEAKGEVTGARLKHVRTGETMEVAGTGLFVAIGHTPNTDLFVGQLDLHDNGYIRTKPGTTQTSVPGVFAAGDVQDFVYRQAVTAAGTGCMAALEAERWLAMRGAH
jgi:thioredoxin reductase (NADPH)